MVLWAAERLNQQLQWQKALPEGKTSGEVWVNSSKPGNFAGFFFIYPEVLWEPVSIGIAEFC